MIFDDKDYTVPKNQTVPECIRNNTIPCRYDEVGKYLDESAKFTILHQPSDAIPESRRIPLNQIRNKTYIQDRRSKGPEDASLTAVMEYNPSLLPLTDDMDPVLINYLTGGYLEDFSSQDAGRVKYLSIRRGGNHHACIGGSRRMNNPTNEHSYLTLVLLVSDLLPIPDASASIRLSQAFLPRFCGQGTRRLGLDPFQDFQIIAERTTKGYDKKDQLFVIASDIRSYIFPIDIRRVPAPTNNASNWNTKIKGKPVPMIVDETSDNWDQVRFYGKGIQIRFMSDNNAPGNRLFCTSVLNSNIMDSQKNYHIFEAKKADGIHTYMEIRPHYEHIVREVNFFADKFHKIGDWEFIPKDIANQTRRNGENQLFISQNDVKDQWNHQHEGNNIWKGGHKARGTACCIEILWDSNQTAMVGISHDVSKGSRAYVSRFYAFEINSGNFNILAISGPFCLSRMKEYDVNFDSAILMPQDGGGNMKIEDTEYDCPTITFASGLVDYQTDPNYAILSYGVSDCYSRSIVISKNTIKKLLNISLFL